MCVYQAGVGVRVPLPGVIHCHRVVELAISRKVKGILYYLGNNYVYVTHNNYW